MLPDRWSVFQRSNCDSRAPACYPSTRVKTTGRYEPKLAAFAILSVLLSPFAFRAALLWDRANTGLALQDARGFLSDAATAFTCLALVILAARVRGGIGFAIAIFWAAIQYGNYEYVRVLDALASIYDIGYLGESTFVLGSALVISTPILLASVLIGTGLLVAPTLRRTPLWAAGVFAAIAVLGYSVYAMWPWSDEVSVWRQTNFIAHNAVRLARDASDDETDGRRFPNSPAAMLDLVPELAVDLDGQPILPLDRRNTNVMLLILESVSGLHVPSIAAVHGHESEVPMAGLDRFARENVAFTSFITQQRKTARGLYALLCGEFPALMHGPLKLGAYAAGDRTCLPAALKNAGYATAYIQAAPLAFHMKGQFMPRAGFERVHGHDYFEREHLRTFWGVDDRTLFEQTLHLVSELDAGDRPWFLTLLTVGTHHPYSIPDDFLPDEEDPDVRAYRYLDEALAEFLASLSETGVLDDTVVLITSDEAKGFRGGNYWLNRLSQNWGFLVVSLPDAPRLEVDETFSQIDLAASVLDLLGLSDQAAQLFGRSVFRHYDSGRWIFFANGNKRDVGALDPEGDVLLCVDNFRKCKRHTPRDERIFASGPTLREWREERDGIVSEMAARSLHTRPVLAKQSIFPLLVEPDVRVDNANTRILFGGQHLTLASDQWIEVEFDLLVRGEAASRIRFWHTLMAGGGRRELFNSERELVGGDRLRIRYSYAPTVVRHNVQSRAFAQLVAGTALDLHFANAKMVLHRDGAPPGPGVTEIRDELDKGAQPVDDASARTGLSQGTRAS